MTDSLTVVVVDDDSDGRELLTRSLTEAQFEVFSCGDAYLALERVRENPPHMIVTDHFLPGMLGVDLIRRVREFSEVPIVGLSARATIELCDTMHRAGANRFLDFKTAVSRIADIAIELVESESRHVHPMKLQDARRRREADEVTRYSSLVAAFDGNISAIARHMGVDRSTVQYHLTRLGLR